MCAIITEMLCSAQGNQAGTQLIENLLVLLAMFIYTWKYAPPGLHRDTSQSAEPNMVFVFSIPVFIKLALY